LGRGGKKEMRGATRNRYGKGEELSPNFQTSAASGGVEEASIYTDRTGKTGPKKGGRGERNNKRNRKNHRGINRMKNGHLVNEKGLESEGNCPGRWQLHTQNAKTCRAWKLAPLVRYPLRGATREGGSKRLHKESPDFARWGVDGLGL